MNVLLGLGMTLLALRGTVALCRDVSRAGRAVGRALRDAGGWVALRVHSYALRRDKARQQRKGAMQACALETINLQAQQIADLNAKLALLTPAPQALRSVP